MTDVFPLALSLPAPPLFLAPITGAALGVFLSLAYGLCDWQADSTRRSGIADGD